MSITKIAEQMVRREYLRKNIPLPAKFWNLVEYKPSYRRQMMLASKFIRTYGIEALERVIDRETWAYSLAAKKFPDLLELEVSKIKEEAIIKEMISKNKSTYMDDIDISDIPLFRSSKSDNSFLEE